jgi:acetyl esterase/lipase
MDQDAVCRPWDGRTRSLNQDAHADSGGDLLLEPLHQGLDVADLETFRQQAPKFQTHELDRLVGPYPQAAATYRARSPLHAVDRIARPVLLVHGLEDTVVPPIQAQVMAEALERRGVRHLLLAIPGEGHGFRRPGSIRRALEVELSFYVSALELSPSKPDAPLPTDGAIAAGPADQLFRKWLPIFWSLGSSRVQAGQVGRRFRSARSGSVQ